MQKRIRIQSGYAAPRPLSDHNAPYQIHTDGRNGKENVSLSRKLGGSTAQSPYLEKLIGAEARSKSTKERRKKRFILK